MVDIDLTLLDRGRVHADMNFVVDGHAVATASNRDPDHEYAEFVVWSLVIDHPEAGDGYWPAPLYEAFAHVDADEHDLEADLDEVDAVVASHLHLDHAGGLAAFEGTDVPVYVHREELPYAYYSATTDKGSIAYHAPDFERELNWEVVGGERRLLHEGVELLHLPGHTPGLLGGLIERDGGEDLLIAGDEAYVAANYEGQPMATGLLWSNRDWRESLRRVRDVERRTGATVLLGHDLERFEAVRESL